MNKSSFNGSMRALYNMRGITKQAHYKRVKQQDKLKEITQQVIASAQEIRKKHRNMGCRLKILKFVILLFAVLENQIDD